MKDIIIVVIVIIINIILFSYNARRKISAHDFFVFQDDAIHWKMDSLLASLRIIIIIIQFSLYSLYLFVFPMPSGEIKLLLLNIEIIHFYPIYNRRVYKKIEIKYIYGKK